MTRLFCFEDRRAPFVDAFARSATNAGYQLELRDPRETSPDLARFERVYRHLSVNSAAFELACFRRYFLMRDALRPGERAIMADSDLLIQVGPSALPAPLRDFDGLVGSVGRDDGVAQEDISPHFSFWSRELLGDFCDALTAIYARESDRLVELFARRRAAQRRPAISDMSLIALWRDRAAIPFLDSNRLFDGVYIDHNVSALECADARFRSAWGRKRMTFRNGDILFGLAQGRAIRPAVIHLQGRYKIAAAALVHGRKAELAVRSAYIALGRAVRRFGMP